MARPIEYKEEYITKVDEYLKLNQDEEVRSVKSAKVSKNSDESTGWQNVGVKLKVKLPTIEGFAVFIDVNKTSLYEWEKKFPEFSNALEKIRTEQHKRLVNMGLSGDYNSTIAKLVLSANHGMRERADVTSDDKNIADSLIGIIRQGLEEKEDE